VAPVNRAKKRPKGGETTSAPDCRRSRRRRSNTWCRSGGHQVAACATEVCRFIGVSISPFRVAPPVTVLALIVLLSGCVGQASSQHGHVVKNAAQHVVLTIEPKRPGREFVLGAVGLSIEARELATDDLSASHRSLVALMRLLGPAVLRVGGNSLDYSWWTSDGEPPPEWATSTVTPADLARLRGLLTATGWRVVLGVDLGHFDPTRAANEAQVAERILGSRLLGFEIGNEPSGYVSASIGLRPDSYTVSNYLEELATYSAAMQTAVPRIHLYGPDLALQTSQAWLLPIASDKSASFTAFDLHYYPTNYSFSKGACKGTPTPTALELLSPEVREREDIALQTMIEAGKLAHREVRISETNDTSSCDVPGGPATSPVFASALWSLDWVLRATSAGVAGLNFHGYLGLCRPEGFTPICAPDHAAEASGQVIARPEYYGLLAARQLEGGRFVPTRLNSPGPLPNLTTWATVTPRGTVRIAIDNLATEGLAQRVSIPISGYAATYETLVGPSVEATTGVALGDRNVTGTRQWRPRRVRLSSMGHSFRVVVHPASAVIITLHPERSRG